MKKTAILLISILLTGALSIAGTGILSASQDEGEREVEEMIEREMMDIEDQQRYLEEEQKNENYNGNDPDNPDREFEDREEEQDNPDEKYQDDRG